MRTATGNLGQGGGRFFLQTDSIAKIGVARFKGTKNPRILRAIAALIRRPMPREQLDREAGCSNGPDLVATLRRNGLTVPCDRAPIIDRDGREVQRGVYWLTATDRRKLTQWLESRTRQTAQLHKGRT